MESAKPRQSQKSTHEYVGIKFIIIEIESWNLKHYNKLIFKYINNMVSFTFNEKILESNIYESQNVIKWRKNKKTRLLIITKQ